MGFPHGPGAVQGERLMGPPTVRRLVWHPVTIAGCLAGVATAAVLAGGPGFAWIAMGATAGFATSGSV